MAVPPPGVQDLRPVSLEHPRDQHNMATATTDRFHIQIRADSARPPIDLPEIFRYWDLLVTLADRDVKVRYKQTVVGVAWVLLQPLMGALIFAFVFGVIARLPSNGRPYLLFAFAGLTPWNTFSQTLSRVGFSLVSNPQLVSKIYFPRLILPLSCVAATLIDFATTLGLIFILMAIYRVWPGLNLLLLPVWLGILLTMALGVGLFAAALMVKYRDISHIIPTFLQLGMYGSPIAWSLEAVPPRYQWIVFLNPLTGLLEAFRWSLLGDGTLPWLPLLYSTASAVALFYLGAIVFRREEGKFADVI
jgi:lipopolysaccharide transport system permease protein